MGMLQEVKAMRAHYSFKNKLILLLIGAVLLVTVLMGISQVYFIMKNYEAMDSQRRGLVEDNILKLMRATDSVYQMIEEPIEKESKALLERMVEDYNRAGISGIDPKDYYNPENGLDIYVIDQADTIIEATFKPDVGLDLSQFEGVGDFLDRVRSKGEFFSDRLSLSSQENQVMKYSYFPTSDGLYIFETGAAIDKEKAIPEELSFRDFGEIVAEKSSFVLSALLFSRYGTTFNEDVTKVKEIDPSYREYYERAIETLQPVSFEGSYNGQAATVKYLPFSFEMADELHKHTVIEIIYSKADLEKTKNQVILLMLLIASLGSLAVAVIAVGMSRMLVSPIKTLHDGMERVARGDYDSKILIRTRDEFSSIAEHFNEMTERIKASMVDQKIKENEIKDLYRKEESMNQALQDMLESNKQSYFETIKALANAEEEKDSYTRGHCERVMNYSLSIGKAIGLPEKDMNALRFGAILHDIGKIGVPEQILNKDTPLTAEEFTLIKKHPSKGAWILNDLSLMKDSLRIVSEHHERHDGRGYPLGIKGDEIAPLAKIVCVADAFDAMTTQRPYRKIAMTVAEAVEELRKNRGTQFDPQLVDVFTALLENGL